MSLYAATKKANELMAHVYSHLYGLPATGLRFFTVYGPWGRPDMAPMLFTRAILEGEPIQVFNHGEMQRDFTYVDDIVEGVVRVLDRRPPHRRPARRTRSTTSATTQPVELDEFIATLERAARHARRSATTQPMQPGDVPATYASIDRLRAADRLRAVDAARRRPRALRRAGTATTTASDVLSPRGDRRGTDAAMVELRPRSMPRAT